MVTGHSNLPYNGTKREQTLKNIYKQINKLIPDNYTRTKFKENYWSVYTNLCKLMEPKPRFSVPLMSNSKRFWLSNTDSCNRKQ